MSISGVATPGPTQAWAQATMVLGLGNYMYYSQAHF